MEIIIVLIVLLLGYGAISNVIHSVKRKKNEKEMAEKLGPILDKACESVNARNIEDLKRQLRVFKDNFTDELVVLQDEKDKSINICPRCGDTLTVKDTSWHGRIIGCPNYPNCGYFEKVSEIKPEIFYELNIKDFS